MPKGQLKSWRRDRGFGFINVEGRDSDVFVHISELRSMGRRPRIGDEITFDIHTQKDGKERAVNCRVKGTQSDPSNKKLPLIIGGIVAFIAAICCFYFLT